jgi:hypothetical protein
MEQPVEISFHQVLDSLLDEETPFPTRFLYRLSDLDRGEMDRLKQVWAQVPLWRRQSLLEDLQALADADLLLSFEAIGRFAIHDQDPQVRAVAVHILWDLEATDMIQTFLNMIVQDPSMEVRAAAATALGHFVYLGEVDKIPKRSLHEIEDRLLDVIENDETQAVRQRSLEALGYSSRPEVPGLIVNALESGEKEWIQAALSAIGNSVDDRWEDQVLHYLDNRFPVLRAEAVRAAGELEMESALPRLFELTEDPNTDVRQAAIWSLSQIGGAGVRQVLEDLWEQTDEEDELDLIENALDNLAFTEDMDLYSMFDLPEEAVDDLLGEDYLVDDSGLEDEAYEVDAYGFGDEAYEEGFDYEIDEGQGFDDEGFEDGLEDDGFEDEA